MKRIFFLALVLFLIPFSDDVFATNCTTTCASVTQFSAEQCNDAEIKTLQSVDNMEVFQVNAPNVRENKLCLTVDYNTTSNGVIEDSEEYCKVVSLINGVGNVNVPFNSSGKHRVDLWSNSNISQPQNFRCNGLEVEVANTSAPSPTPTPTPRNDCIDQIGLNCQPRNDSSCTNIPYGVEAVSFGNQPTYNNCIPLCEGTICGRDSSSSTGYKIIGSKYLDAESLIDNVAPGTIGGACVAGDISLNMLKQPDIVKDSGKDANGDLAQQYKKSTFNLPGLYRSINIFIKSFFNATATTEFCPVDDKSEVVPIFYSARDSNNKIDKGSKVDITLEEDRSIQTALNSSQSFDKFTQSLQDKHFSSIKLRIAQALFHLRSTGSMGINDKKKAIDEIQKILWKDGINNDKNPALSCMCVSRSAAAIDLKKSNKEQSYMPTPSNTISKINSTNVLGATAPHGEVLGSIAETCSNLPLPDRPSCIQELEATCKNYSDESTCIDSIGQSCSLTDIRCIVNVQRFINNCRPLLDAKFSSTHEYNKCVECGLKDSGTWTALGCFSSDFSTIIKKIFSVLLGFGGLVALGCIIYASFLMQTSAGNPEKTKKAQELITSCIAGLILIIFSVFILRVIGVDILRIPGFS